MRSAISFVIVIGLAIAGGCANKTTLSHNQCTAGDWQSVGYRDGQQGYASTRILAHQEACGRQGIVPSRKLYMIGWSEGVETFCQPDNGFSLGEYGKGHGGICPSHLRSDFLSAYDQGRSLYLARRDVNRLESTLAKREQRLEYIDAQVIELTADQIDPTLTPQERVHLFTDTKKLVDERQRIEQEIPGLNVELDHAVRHLDSVQQTLASGY